MLIILFLSSSFFLSFFLPSFLPDCLCTQGGKMAELASVRAIIPQEIARGGCRKIKFAVHAGFRYRLRTRSPAFPSPLLSASSYLSLSRREMKGLRQVFTSGKTRSELAITNAKRHPASPNFPSATRSFPTPNAWMSSRLPSPPLPSGARAPKLRGQTEIMQASSSTCDS